ncbi:MULTISPECIES: hypothetical protein [Brevibacillus]|jgi:hypothetical protein|uniref:Uncharacterized protein n=1 Tax=Brevibacillus borstelensis AK1 TaxID=1300222 RepID=M8EFS4_9BACL|nr:hypothetical protein [Brevibacillus borstelensis]EMT54330.1 hypothetical protein I532_01950 [Brevibacillus borstelensis AK1]KKX54076.1 hypothetical protein X546_17105 [Brevibacillus borstelensis cifa_chp40]MBE5398106.1 hypothetical protein [Brevibacillus borstelensis]MED1746296.1 hypothetical protein [Brevibacillus borstelensis]MED1852434.1 hypothetical protein [Brevibacillus borstelensis]
MNLIFAGIFLLSFSLMAIRDIMLQHHRSSKMRVVIYLLYIATLCLFVAAFYQVDIFKPFQNTISAFESRVKAWMMSLY